jgi:membrane-associated phospholipid phosphatase
MRTPDTRAGSPALSPRIFGRLGMWLSLFVSATFFGVFVLISQKVVFDPDSSLVAADRWLLLFTGRARQSGLTAFAVDLTAMGSPTVLGIFLGFVMLVLSLTKDWIGVTLISASGAGAVVLTAVLKTLVGRGRPQLVPHLVEVAGLSYPSGHALAAAAIYLSGAIIASRHLGSRWQQMLVLSFSALVVIAIAWSRVYLGVHYPTDAVAGTSLGFAWGFLLAAATSWFDARRSSVV